MKDGSGGLLHLEVGEGSVWTLLGAKAKWAGCRNRGETGQLVVNRPHGQDGRWVDAQLREKMRWAGLVNC
jgi:hypothetical protein